MSIYPVAINKAEAMYLIDFIAKLKQENTYESFWFKSQAKLTKYHQYLKYIKRDYRWLLMFIVARFPLGRNLGNFCYRDRSNKTDDHQNIASIFKDLDINQVVLAIKENGCCLGITLPADILQEILEFAYSTPISVDENPQLKFKLDEKKQAAIKYNQDILIGNYLDANTNCLALKKLGSDAKLQAIAGKYLGNEPVLIRSQMGWCFVGEKEAYAQKGEIGNPLVLFHYDLDDYRALKFFFYLTEVNSLSGSHLCVAGSHKKRKFIHYILRSQSDRDIADYYGSDNIVNICGTPGFGFAEDPFCFHRGSPPVNSPRLMIQLEFALHDYGMWN